MKFTVSSGELLARLSIVGKAIGIKSSIPVLDYFLFTIEGNTLKIKASDSEITIETNLEISNVDGEGQYIIPGDKICNYLRKLPEQPIHFNLNVETNTIETITNNGITKQITPHKPEEYPVLPSINNDETLKFSINSNVILNGISKTIFATSNDELRVALTGIYVGISNNSITFVATDSHIMTRFIASDLNINGESKFVLTKKSAQMLKSVLSKEEDVQVESNGKLVLFKTKNYTLTARLIESPYPNYNNLIPNNNPYTLTINRQDLLNTIERASVYAGAYVVLFNCTEEQVKIMSQDSALNCSSQETLQCVYNGQPLSIGFKSTILIDILSNITAEEVKINMGDPSRAGIVQPATPTQNEDELMLLMPMMV